MLRISFTESFQLVFQKSTGGQPVLFESYRDYLVNNSQYGRLKKSEEVAKIVYKLSAVEGLEAPFHRAVAQRGDSVLFYNGTGGFGDQIMTWPVVKKLSETFEVHVLTEPGNNVCWWNFPWVKTVQTIPIQYDQLSLFKHRVFFESVCNNNEHPDQEHPVDNMLRRLGYNPDAIPPEDKVVQPIFSHHEIGGLMPVLKQGKPIGMIQLASANPVRCLSASDSAHLAAKVASAFPDMLWLGLFDAAVAKDQSVYPETLKQVIKSKGLTNLQPFNAPNLRELWALARHAKAVISPDSMMVHVAGMWGVPCVGLWGVMAPDRRIRYYKNHHPIFHPENCPRSPCFHYGGTFPTYCPNRPTARTCCDVLASISPDEVIEAVKSMVK